MRRFTAIALSSILMLQAAPLFAAPAGPAPRAGAQATTGTINGTAQSSAGQTLPNYTVQLRNLQTGQIAGTTTSNAAGTFSFTGLNPATYVVEVVNSAGAVVGTSAPLAVTAGATVGVTVSTTAATAIGGAAGTSAGVSTALIVTSIAAAAGIVGVVVATRDDASPSR